MNYRPSDILKVALLFSWCLGLAAILALMGPERAIDAFCSITPQGVRDFVSSFGLPATFAYVLFHAARSFVFLPVTPFTIAGGFLFGMADGLALTIIGRTLASAIITFGLSRYLFKDYVRSRIKNKYAGWDERLESGGIAYVAILRMIPLLPFDVVGYAAGVSGISLKKYLIGTILGDLPGVLVLTFLGSGLAEPGSGTFYMSILMALAVAAASWLYIIIFINKNWQIKGKPQG